VIKRALVDINVLLDVLAKREPFLASAVEIWSVVETGRVRGLVAADSFSTIYYLLRRASNHRTALRALRLIRDVFEIVPLDEQTIHQALDSPLGDFEDAIQYVSALRSGADCIVTRDLGHFRSVELPVLAPDAFLASLETK
jgi:predicted nucleic acid-binding protein